jgi:hypothetical protein
MDALTTELLARIEMLEDDVKDLQRQLDEGGVVFYADMNLVSDEQLLDLWDIEGEPEQ